MKVLIPLAAPADGHFDPKHYYFPKPLIEVHGRPMIELVIDNLRRLGPDVRFVFVLRADDCRNFGLDQVVRMACDDAADIVVLDQSTDGSVCSALMAVDHIDDDQPLIIANGDQILEEDLAAQVERFLADGVDAGVLTFNSVHPRWSYVRLDATGLVAEAVEKRPISRHAVAGFYFFRRGADFIRYAMASMRAHRAHDGQYFVAPVLNEAILEGGRVAASAIDEDTYHSLYSPQRLEQYEAHLSRLRPLAGRVPSRPAPLVIVPMAGRGSRFAEVGYVKPKPFIDVAGKPMIVRVIDNLAAPGADFLLLARPDHLAAEPETIVALKARGNVFVQPVDQTTEGAACTVLLARSEIDRDRPIVIANCDQIIDFDLAAFLADAEARGLDGSVLCFRDPERNPKWSFVGLDNAGLVRELREKDPISDLATVGLYYFARGRDFVAAAVDMVARNDRTNGEFYVGPVYTYAVANGLRIGVQEIPAAAMHGIGTPADLRAYLGARP